MTRRQRRLALVLLVLALVSVAALLLTRALRSSMVFFVTPAQILRGEARGKETLRVGGLVTPGSVQRQGSDLRFVLMDAEHRVPVHYQGILPDLFAEGKGAVAQGRLDAQGTLQASEVLAKHDENYTPPGMQTPASAAHAAGVTERRP